MKAHEAAALPIEEFCAASVRLEGVAPLQEMGVNIDSLVKLGDTCIFEAPVFVRARLFGHVEIGAYTYTAAGEIAEARIGRFCPLAAGVLIGPAEHPVDWLSVHPFQYDGTGLFKDEAYDGIRAHRPFNRYASQLTEIGHDCWIGANAIVRTGRRIGNGAIVGAGSVVTKDVEPYLLTAGAPARPIRPRFDAETIAEMQEIAWWRWDLAAVKDALLFEDAAACLRVLREALGRDKLKENIFRRAVTRRDENERPWLWIEPLEPMV